MQLALVTVAAVALEKVEIPQDRALQEGNDLPVRAVDELLEQLAGPEHGKLSSILKKNKNMNRDGDTKMLVCQC